VKIIYKSNNPNGEQKASLRNAKSDEFGRIVCGKTVVRQWATLGEACVFCSQKDFYDFPDVRGIKLKSL